jgi:hypothetical protein
MTLSSVRSNNLFYFILPLVGLHVSVVSTLWLKLSNQQDKNSFNSVLNFSPRTISALGKGREGKGREGEEAAVAAEHVACWQNPRQQATSVYSHSNKIDNKQHSTPSSVQTVALSDKEGLGLPSFLPSSLSLRASSFANVLVLVRAVTRMNRPN